MANPPLATLLDEVIGERWRTHLEELEGLAPNADDPAFLERWQAVRDLGKQRLAQYMRTRRWGPSSIREMRCRIWKSPG